MKTSRLVLRSLELADSSRVQELAGVSEVSGSTLNIPYPYPDGLAETWISSVIEKEQAGKSSRTWGIEMNSELVGVISLDVDDTHQVAEIGYWLGVQYWGKGVMSEAGLAVVRYGFENLEIEKVYGRYFVSNPASGRVLQKIGMTYEGHLRKHIRRAGVSRDVLVYGIIRSEFEKMKKEGKYES